MHPHQCANRDRNPFPPCTLWLVFLILTPPATADQAEPIRVLAQAAPGKHYVGEVIDFAIEAVAEGERPQIIPPRIAGMEITPTGTDLIPLSASGIGDVIEERNLFRYLFRITPYRAGVLEIPPFRVRLGERSGVSKPVRMTVQDLPAADRPAEFLGGVGKFEVTAEARPSTVRKGQELEYRVLVTGPAARGMSGAPALKRFDRVPLGLEVEPLIEEVIADPPSRVFRSRLRPTRAGAATLPPVAIAAFDPRSERYMTKVTSGVPIRVVDVPRFDPATLRYAPPAFRPAPIRGWVVEAAAGGLGAAAVTLLAVHRARTQRGTEARAKRLAARLSRGLNALQDASEVGRHITEALAAYLNLIIRRPPGALTPEEARQGIAEATGSPDFGERAWRLVVRCDRARYAGKGPTARELITEAGRLFDDLERGRKSGRGVRGGGIEAPREAARTATRWE